LPYKLTENAVISRVKVHLQKLGFTDIQTKNTRQRGIDLQATASDGRTKLYVEAKGEKSSKPDTSRYEVGFNTSQKKDHLGKQLLWACRVLAKKSDHPVRIGIALPADKKNSELIEEIEPILKRLGIVAFLTAREGTILVRGKPL
jgi:hypothetical protein